MKKLTTLLTAMLLLLNVSATTYTQIERPDVPKELMNVSVYDEVKVKSSELPITYSKTDVDFVKEFKITNKPAIDITKQLQEAIDKYSAKGGANIHIKKGDYTLSTIELRSNIHLMFESETIIRPYIAIKKGGKMQGMSLFVVGNNSGNGTAPTVKNVSIESVGGRTDVLLPEEMQGYEWKFALIASTLVEDFYYANFDVYDHKTVMSTLIFLPATRNDDNFVGSTNGVVMNITTIDAHFGYGTVQAWAGRNIRFYNIHGIGGLTLRLETGLTTMNHAQFGGVWDIVGQNITVANGHGAAMLGPHTMINGVCHLRDITSYSSSYGVGIGETDADREYGAASHNRSGHPGRFGDGTSIHNVTAIFGFDAQVKTKSLDEIPWEYRDKIGKPDHYFVINGAPSHSCVKIATRIKLDYDESTFHAIGFEYGDPINIKLEPATPAKKGGGKMYQYIMQKYNVKRGPNPESAKVKAIKEKLNK